MLVDPTRSEGVDGGTYTKDFFLYKAILSLIEPAMLWIILKTYKNKHWEIIKT